MTITKAVELLIDGSWVSITDYVQWRGSNRLTITRGKANEQSSFSPSTCSFILNNRDGRFSDRNPLSPYYGLIGRNTRVRVLTDWDEDTFTRSDGATLGSTEIKSDPWTESPGSAWTISSNMARCTLANGTSADAYLSETYYDVTVAAKVRVSSVTNTVEFGIEMGYGLPGVSTVQMFRATLSSVGGNVFQTYRSDNNPTYSVQLNHEDGITLTANTWYWIKASISNGHVVAKYWLESDPEPSEWMANYAYNNAGDSSVGGVVKDAVDYNPGRVGLFFNNESSGGSATMDCDHFVIEEHAFTGEIPAWPSRWDNTGRDVYMPITASGIGRRMNVTPKPLVSPIRSELTAAYRDRQLLNYWPMEDGANTDLFASALSGGAPLESAGLMTAAGYSDFPGSAPVVLASTNGRFFANLPLSGDPATFADTGTVLSVAFLLYIPAGFATHSLIELEVSGASDSIRYWRLNYTATGGGTLELLGVTSAGATVVTSTAFDYGVDGKRCGIAFKLTQDAGDCDWEVGVWQIADNNRSTTYVQGTGTFASTIHGAAKHIKLSKGGFISPGGVGHLAVGNFSLQVLNRAYVGIFDSSLIGHYGEPASTRIERLAMEYGIPMRVAHWTESALDTQLDATSPPMGVQPMSGTVLNEIFAAEQVDHGILYEPTDGLELAYISRQVLYNRRIDLELDYDDADFSAPFEPQDDDQGFTNSFTVTRDSGSYATVEITNGRLNVNDPEDTPRGVGRYPSGTTLNIANDSHAVWQAGWMVHQAAWDEIRYPRVTLELARSAHSAVNRQKQIRALDIGKPFTFVNLPSWMPQETITAKVFGYTQEISHHTHTLTFNTAPDGPYRVGIWGNDGSAKHSDENGSRWDSRTTVTDADFDAGTDTSMVVTFDNERRWVTTASESGSFPFLIMVGGVLLTVTGISGSASPQTFTITATPVNGIVKTIPAGTEVHVYKPARWAL